MLDMLARHGKPGRGPVGDLEITFEADQIAGYGLLIGDAQQGAQCVALVRPLIDDALRHLVFDLISRFEAAVFDDALACAYVTGRVDDLPAAFASACVSGVQRISSPLQLWPAGLCEPAPARERPALRFTNPNPQGVNYVMFDRAEMAQQHLHMEFATRAAACNPGTLRALRNVLLKVDTALVANEGFQVSYHFEDPEANLLLLESPQIAEMHAQATMVVSGEVMMGAPVPEPLFVMDADWYFSNRHKAADLRKQAQAQGMEIAPGIAGMAALDALLERLHQAVLKERGTRAAGADAYNEKLLRWADGAGACIGEAIRTGIGGQWGGVTIMGQRHPVVRTHTGRNTWPKLIAFNRIMNGAGQSVAAYVDELARTALSPTPRNADIAADIPQLCHILLGHGQFHHGGLPLQEQLPVAQLDYSVQSLRVLDAYLTAAHAVSGGLEHGTLSNLSLAGGAYLGEVVRRNAGGYWTWTNYEDFFSKRPADPEMSKSVNNCALLLGPGIAVLPMQACNVGAWGAAPRSVHAQALEWMRGGEEDSEEAPADQPGLAGDDSDAAPPGLNISIDIAAAVATLKPEERAYVQVQPPPWVAGDDLQRLVNDYPKLLQQGRVVWAHLVQANNALFAPGKSDSPAELIYDPHGRMQPEDLAPLAQRLFQLKGTQPADPDEARIAQHLTAEISRAFGMPVPRGISPDGLLLSTVLVLRKHLPNQRLSLGHVPVLISDACPGSVMILPGRWWPRALAEQWGIEEEQPSKPAAVEPPNVHAAKDQVLHVVKPPVPGSDEAAWAHLDQLLEAEDARRLGQKKGFLGKLLGRKETPEPRLPDPLFARYLGQMNKAYPNVCDMPDDLGGEVLSLLVAAASVNYVVETARREFGLTVFDANHFNIVYRPAPKTK